MGPFCLAGRETFDVFDDGFFDRAVYLLTQACPVDIGDGKGAVHVEDHCFDHMVLRRRARQGLDLGEHFSDFVTVESGQVRPFAVVVHFQAKRSFFGPADGCTANAGALDGIANRVGVGFSKADD